MTKLVLHEGDNRISLRRMIDDGIFVDSVITDPPYGLTSITKRFGAKKAAPAGFGTDGAFGRLSSGFMGSTWDGSGIERDPEFWALIYDVLKPGGYVAAFSSPRTGHWQACAMESAGFIMHPFIVWAYGQGMPKAHNAAMAIDKELGIIGTRGEPKSRAHAAWIERGAMRGDEGNDGWQREWMDDPKAVEKNARRYEPGCKESSEWDGWAYGAQALKPAFEPIYIAQKPFSEKNGALNLIKHGVGAINIDACRVPTDDDDRQNYGISGDEGKPSANAVCYGERDRVAYERPAAGRHPANLIHDTSGPVMGMFPGGSARFFNAFPADPGPLFYHGKATKVDRAGSKHPTVKPVTLMRWLCRLFTPPGGTILDPFGGSGTTGKAAIDEGFTALLCEADPLFINDIRTRFDLNRCNYDTEIEELLGRQIVPDLIG